MFRLLTTILFSLCFVVNVNAQNITPDPQPEKTTKMMPIMLECDAEPKNLFDLVQSEKYQEQPFAAGSAIVRSAVTGQFFPIQTFMLVNVETRSFSMIGIFQDGSGCLLLNGHSFTPYIEPGRKL
jgi:hypothetical protein